MTKTPNDCGRVLLRRNDNGQRFVKLGAAPEQKVGGQPTSVLDLSTTVQLRLPDGERGLRFVANRVTLRRRVAIAFAEDGAPLLIHVGIAEGDLAQEAWLHHDFVLEPVVRAMQVKLTDPVKLAFFLGQEQEQRSGPFLIRYEEVGALRSAVVQRRMGSLATFHLDVKLGPHSAASHVTVTDDDE